MTPEVRAAYDRAAAVATAVRQFDTGAALSVLEELDHEQLIHVALGLASMVRRVFTEYCADDADNTELVWSAWLLACQRHWDAS